MIVITTQMFQKLKPGPNLRLAGIGTIWLFLAFTQKMVSKMAPFDDSQNAHKVQYNFPF